MIYTLTMNPCIDKFYYFDEIKRGDVNRPEKIENITGGKGINVSKALNVMGCSNKALFFSGGKTGEKFQEMAAEEGIEFISIGCSGETRTNLMLRGLKTQEEIRVNEKGPVVNRENIERLYEEIGKLKKEDTIIISGSLPEGVEESFYYEIGSRIKSEKGSNVIIDSDLEEMKYALKCGLFMIKPNREELARITGGSGEIGELIELCNKYEIKYGFLSDGKKGAYLYSNKKLYRIIPPEVKALTTVGAGDSFIGGFIAGITSGKELKECLKYAAGLSAAKVEGKFNRERAEELSEKAVIEEADTF